MGHRAYRGTPSENRPPRATRFASHVRAAMSSRRRASRANPVLVGSRLDPNDRTLSWMSAEPAARGQRSHRHRTERRLLIDGLEQSTKRDFSLLISPAQNLPAQAVSGSQRYAL